VVRVLLIEDDSRIRRFVTKGLNEESYVVETAKDGEEGRFCALNREYDLVILDLMLPGSDGEEILRQMRSKGKVTPVLALTAKDAVADKVRLLDAGADDYMTKPFSFSELSARLRALFRRSRAKTDNTIRIADVAIDPLTRKVSRAGEEIELTATEFNLLLLMAQNEGRVLTRSVIAEQIWDEQFESFSNVIDVHLNRLRRKLDRDRERRLLHTVRGVGYVLRIEDQGV
jgi:DNA-binding response OmpR family regulator